MFWLRLRPAAKSSVWPGASPRLRSAASGRQQINAEPPLTSCGRTNDLEPHWFSRFEQRICHINLQNTATVLVVGLDDGVIHPYPTVVALPGPAVQSHVELHPGFAVDQQLKVSGWLRKESHRRRQAEFFRLV